MSFLNDAPTRLRKITIIICGIAMPERHLVFMMNIGLRSLNLQFVMVEHDGQKMAAPLRRLLFENLQL